MNFHHAKIGILQPAGLTQLVKKVTSFTHCGPMTPDRESKPDTNKTEGLMSDLPVVKGELYEVFWLQN